MNQFTVYCAHGPVAVRADESLFGERVYWSSDQSADHFVRTRFHLQDLLNLAAFRASKNERLHLVTLSPERFDKMEAEALRSKLHNPPAPEPEAVDEKYATPPLDSGRPEDRRLAVPIDLRGSSDDAARVRSMRETAEKPPTTKLVIHSMNHATVDAPCGARYEDLRFNDEHQAWVKTLKPASLDVPRCLDCLKIELTRLQDQFAHQKMLQGVERPLGGLEMLPLTAPTPVDHLDEDLLCEDE